MNPTVFHVESIYGANTRKGLVHITWMGKSLQVMPAEAREMAMNLLRCAEGAETDEAIMRWAGDGSEDQEMGVTLLHALRTAREEVWNEAGDDA